MTMTHDNSLALLLLLLWTRINDRKKMFDEMNNV